jgi:hypothetical protein
MSPVGTSGAVFVFTFGGALTGMLLNRVLPRHHLSTESKDVVKAGMGLVATMTALVLGLLVSSAKSSYDTQSNEVTDMAAKVLVLDRTLARYGPETQELRGQLRGLVAEAVNRIFPEDGTAADLEPDPARGSVLLEELTRLEPKSDEQKEMKGYAMTTAMTVMQERWLMYEQHVVQVSQPMLVIVVFWLTILFMSFGVYAPWNGTVVTALLAGALAVSGAVFLILEMYVPFGGMIHISSAPLKAALQHMGK